MDWQTNNEETLTMPDKKNSVIKNLSNFGHENKEFYKIIEKSLSGVEINIKDAVILFNAKGREIDTLYNLANQLRYQANGNHVSFVINRNINFTNICHIGCSFCGFAKNIKDINANWYSLEEIVKKASDAWNRGATEVCIQGGLHPKMDGNYYREIILSIKSKLPDMHIHAFSPFEIWYGSAKTKLSIVDFLSDLKECGLGSMPGTAAEILDTEIRYKLTKNKLSAEKWIEIIKTAHKIGIPTTSTIMYGHLDNPKHWASHLSIIREIQKETGGFTEFIPLSFVHSNSPLFIRDTEKRVRPGPSLEEKYKMHSVSRIMFFGLINNIQASWPKLGPQIVQKTLDLGANDLGGTLMNESISRSAGATYGEEITANEMARVIKAANKIPVQRNTLYKFIKTFERDIPTITKPLVERNGLDPLNYLNK